MIELQEFSLLSKRLPTRIYDKTRRVAINTSYIATFVLFMLYYVAFVRGADVNFLSFLICSNVKNKGGGKLMAGGLSE